MSGAVANDGPPVWQQYSRIKRELPDTILLFRLGDFYETFDDDARIIARELDLVLTSREMGKGRRHPLAGIPYHSLDGYLARLVGRGLRVAICEQTSEPGSGRGLVDRAVTRIVTPGTLAEPHLLEPRSNNFLASLVIEGGTFGLAHVDISTGEFMTCQQTVVESRRGIPPARRGAIPPHPEALRQVAQELQRLSVAELLVPQDGFASAILFPDNLAGGARVTPFEAWRFALDLATARLQQQFEIATLDPLGCADKPLATRAAGALMQYIGTTASDSLRSLHMPRTYDISGFMALDGETRRNLELLAPSRERGKAGSLLGILDRTSTPMGARQLRTWVTSPLIDSVAIETRLDGITALVEADALRTRLGNALKSITDIQRLTIRVVQGRSSPRDVIALGKSLAILPAIVADLERASDENASIANHLDAFARDLQPMPDLVALIEAAIIPEPPATLAEGGVIAIGHSPALDALMDDTREAREWMASLETREREQTGVRGLRVGYNRVFGYYLEASISALRNPLTVEMQAQVDTETEEITTIQDFLEKKRSYVRKQTLVGAERYLTPELKEKEGQILEAQERIVALETRLFGELCQTIAGCAAELTDRADALAKLDALLSLANVAVTNNYTRPVVTDGGGIVIRGGRHPVVEQAASESGFVPNDVVLNNRVEQVLIVTGPNMAGKSTYLRQVALIVLLAQIGSFVPADHAEIGLVDRIFTRVGAQDDIATGQSTFMVEMTETANILNHATPRSLVILDEIGRGTSTYDGMAIARAIVEHIHDHPRLGCKTIFATHYHELTELENTLERVRNMRVDVVEEGDRVVFLHRVVPGGADRSYGIHVARLAGIPASVTMRARELLRALESRKRAPRPPPGRIDDSGIRGLFDPPAPVAPSDPLLDVIANLDPDQMTPMDALATLARMREQLRARNYH